MLPTGGYGSMEIATVLDRIATMTDGPVGLTLNIRRDQSERLRACLDGGARIIHVFWGDQAAWLGTRFVMAVEAATHPIYAEAVKAATEADTYYSELFDIGWPDAPTRVLRNSLIEEWEAEGRPPPGNRPGEGESVAYSRSKEFQRFGTASPAKDMAGDVELLAMYAGQSVALIDDVRPAEQIVSQLLQETQAALRR